MSAQPEDNFVTDRVGAAGLIRLATQAADATGIPQRLHLHAAGQRCNLLCREIT